MAKTDDLDKKIALGICVSTQGTDRCPRCVDSCDAFGWKCEIHQNLKDAGIKSNIFNNDETKKA